MNKLKRIVKAVVEDAITTALKLKGWFLPKKTIGVVAEIVGPALAQKFSRRYHTLNWDRSDWRSYYFREENLVTLRTSDGDEKLDAVALIERTPQSAPFEFEWDPTPFKLPSSVIERSNPGADTLLKGGKLFDGSNARLSGVTWRGDRAVLRAQPARYHDYVRSNLSMDFRLQAGVSTLREQVHPDGRLDRLEDSPLANLIGVNMLIFTPSGKLIVPTRSADATFRRSTYTPSSSGTLEPSDVLAKNFFAETHREIGLVEADVQSGPHFIGMSRELVRGGQPEMFFVATVNRTDDEIHEAWKSAQERHESEKLQCFDGFGQLAWDGLSDEGQRRAFQRALDQLIHATRAKASLPFLTHLALLRNFVLNETTTR